MTTYGAVWSVPEVARRYLDDRRGVVPMWPEMAGLFSRLLGRLDGVGRFIDLGAGDGVIAQLVWDCYPAAEGVLVDMSLPMIEAARERLVGRDGWAMVEADLGSSGWLSRLPSPDGYDLVVSSFCIHHLPDERKRELYGEIRGVLVPGGHFVNWEHVTCRGLADGMFDQTVAETIVEKERAAGKGRAVEVVVEEYRARPDAAENRLADVWEQAGWLTELGFTEVEVYAKWLEIAMFGGQRPQ